MTGDNINCKKCGTTLQRRGKAMTLAMTCQSCNAYFRTGPWNKDIDNFVHSALPALPIGTKGKIENVVYEVMGFVVKQETKYHYKWREYLLFNPYMGFAFLSEYEGNWNFIWPVEENPKDNIGSETSFTYKEQKYLLYQKYRAAVLFAKGEFFFDVVDITASTVNYEFIAPPFLYGLEISDDSMLWTKGEYLSPNEVAAAFSVPINMLPPKQGRSYTQPIVTNFSEKSLLNLTGVFLFLILLSQFLFNQLASEKVVYQGKFELVQLSDQKFFVTPSFTLAENLTSLEIDIHSPVDNDWFYAEFSLLNEANGEEIIFSKEIQFYKGYEDGSSWSEGSTRGSAFLSSIPAGTYHINIYPEFGFTAKSFSMVVKHDVPIYSNYFIASFCLLLFPIGFYIRKRIIEGNRWSESDYSPYHSE